MPLSRRALDAMACSEPGCDCAGDLYMHSACHPGWPTWSVYSDGVLRIECAEPGCKKMIVEVVVHDDRELP